MNAQNQNQSPVMRRFYQMVAGTRKQPAGVCAGYFRSATAARAAYPRLTGYVRRVNVPDDLAIDVWGDVADAKKTSMKIQAKTYYSDEHTTIIAKQNEKCPGIWMINKRQLKAAEKRLNMIGGDGLQLPAGWYPTADGGMVLDNRHAT